MTDHWDEPTTAREQEIVMEMNQIYIEFSQ